MENEKKFYKNTVEYGLSIVEFMLIIFLFFTLSVSLILKMKKSKAERKSINSICSANVHGIRYQSLLSNWRQALRVMLHSFFQLEWMEFARQATLLLKVKLLWYTFQFRFLIQGTLQLLLLFLIFLTYLCFYWWNYTMTGFCFKNNTARKKKSVRWPIETKLVI